MNHIRLANIFSSNAYSISERSLNIGSRVILAGEFVRIFERWYHTYNIRNLFPEIAIHQFPANLPIELWSTPWPEISVLVGLIGLYLAFKEWKWSWVGFLYLMVFNSFTAFGGSSIGKSMILLQPALLMCLLIHFFYKFKKTNLSLLGLLPITLLAGMYGFNAIAKTGPEWMDGTAIAKYFTSNLWSIGLSEEPTGIFWKLLNWGTLIWEMLAFILLVPFKFNIHKNIRMIYGSFAILFHLLLLIFGPFHALGVTAIGVWCILLFAKNEAEPIQWNLHSVIPATWILWIFLCNLPLLGIETPRTFAETMNKVALYPQWKLFAPSPTSGKVIVELEMPGKEKKRFDTYSSSMSFLLDVGRIQDMWKHFSEEVCKHHQGKLHLQITKNDKLQTNLETTCSGSYSK